MSTFNSRHSQFVEVKLSALAEVTQLRGGHYNETKETDRLRKMAIVLEGIKELKSVADMLGAPQYP